MSDWIRVEDELPESGEIVRIGNEASTGIGYFDSTKLDWFAIRNFGHPSYHAVKVTHWRRIEQEEIP